MIIAARISGHAYSMGLSGFGAASVQLGSTLAETTAVKDVKRISSYTRETRKNMVWRSIKRAVHSSLIF
jgi:hypothetical protein